MCFPISHRYCIVAHLAHHIPDTFLRDARAEVSSFYAISGIQHNLWNVTVLDQLNEAGCSIGGQPVMKIIGMNNPPFAH
jgi:hypothetical protein